MPLPLSSRVELRDDRPTLLLNESPVAPLIYALSDCPGARWSWEEVPTRNISEFGKRGVRLFQVDIWLNQMLDDSGDLDIALARRQIAGVTSAAPDGAVMLRLHLNPSKSWIDAHPEEWVGYADTEPRDLPIHGLHRPLAHDGDRPKRASFYSTIWQQWAHAMLKEFCEKLAATPEGDALFGLQLANGVYGEWHQFGFLHHDPDSGLASTVAFRLWLQNKYGDEAALAKAWNSPGLTWETAQVPDSPAREKASIGILRDPQTQRAVIDYFTFQHTTLTDVVVSFGATAKAAWPRPLVTAAFFGYFYSIFGRQAAGAQLAAQNALQSPHLDAWCSPQSYEDNARNFGGPGNARGIIGVVRRAGKLWLDEMDMPTSHVGCPWKENFSSTPADDIAIHRRNVLQPVTRGGGQWWYDFGPIGCTPNFAGGGNSGWWDTPELLAEVEAIQRIAQQRVNQPFQRPADVLLVHDPMSFCHTVSQRHPPAEFGKLPFTTSDPITPLLVDDLLHGLYATGVVFDEALIGELETIDLTPYRLVLFATTPVITTAQRENIQTRVAQNGRHVALLGFAGWSDGDTTSAALAESLSGIPTRLHQLESVAHDLELEGITETRTLDHPIPVPAFEADENDRTGKWADASVSAARRTTETATWWTFALPPTTPAFLRQLALTAGCHAVNDHAEVTLIGDGLIIPHTIEGGHRRLQWPGGPVIEAELPPRSTTVFDGLTGERLLG
ncbi:MAG: hypothetical protein QNK90_01930 [Opitutaceae bacterium]|tara:strand:+ start:3863 stop:6046 length:2184 start_codon:yes stop_codon:yes gene_type:complete